uniref:Transmembrane p24 trafficking protein 4 n=1 Tax=Suricata suricatta TaxID=37032 RepID=A0A673SVE8_SURSU
MWQGVQTPSWEEAVLLGDINTPVTVFVLSFPHSLTQCWPVIINLFSESSGDSCDGRQVKSSNLKTAPDLTKGNYRTQMWDKQKEVFLPSTPGLGMHVEVKDPEGKVVLSRQYGSEGRFTFTSHTPGDHQICLHSNSTKMSLFAGGRLRVHLDIQGGEHANNYPEIAAKDKLTELQLRARQLLDQVEQIQKEQDYQRYREERFRLTSESTNQRVLWWSLAQTVILILTGIWQMRHLKSFFEAKKLV